MTTTPTVSLPPDSHIYRGAVWAKALRNNMVNLDKYGLAQVKIDESIPTSQDIGVRRHEHSFLCKVEDKFVLIDTWDFSDPGYGWIQGAGSDIDIKCILKIQCSRNGNYVKKRNTQIFPWTMFHMCQQEWLANLDEFRSRYNSSDKKYDVGFSGRMWGWRSAWKTKLESMDNAQFSGYPRTPPGHFTTYVYDQMINWKIGLSLVGKRDRLSDGKNRREVEYASFGMPMILNYKPFYLNEMKPGTHYVHCENVNDLDKIVDEIITDKELYRHLSESIAKWWEENASEHGVCKTFMQVMSMAGIV